MMEDTTLTQMKQLTFYERMRLTFLLLCLPWRLPAGWLAVVWSSGATASFLVIEARIASLHIVSGNGLKEFSMTLSKRHKTMM